MGTWVFLLASLLKILWLIPIAILVFFIWRVIAISSNSTESKPCYSRTGGSPMSGKKAVDFDFIRIQLLAPIVVGMEISLECLVRAPTWIDFRIAVCGSQLV